MSKLKVVAKVAAKVAKPKAKSRRKMGKKPLVSIMRTRQERNAAIVEWINRTLPRLSLSKRTSTAIAAICAKSVGFPVTSIQMARELDRAGVSFLRSPGDPPKGAFSKVEYLRAGQTTLEDRIARLEKKLFGKTFERKVAVGSGKVVGKDGYAEGVKGKGGKRLGEKRKRK